MKDSTDGVNWGDAIWFGFIPASIGNVLGALLLAASPNFIIWMLGKDEEAARYLSVSPDGEVREVWSCRAPARPASLPTLVPTLRPGSPTLACPAPVRAPARRPALAFLLPISRLGFLAALPGLLAAMRACSRARAGATESRAEGGG